MVGRPGTPVHDLRFEGLIFAHTEWQPPADYASSLQAGIEVPGAVLFDYAERCAVTDGCIEHIGNYGVEVNVGCADIEIARNRITDIGAGGIRIGHFFSWETDGTGRLTERGLRRKAAMPTGPRSRRVTVADNVIAHCGRFTPEAVGVFVGDNPDNKIIHNHIYDLFYSGISVGSVQDFGPSQATGNIIEYNHVHDIGQGMLSDLAGIYTCSTPGSRIAYNVVHDVVRSEYGGWGIYPDEGSHDLLIQKNLVYRCQDGALFAHHNRDVTAENNIFALNRHRSSRARRNRRVRADIPPQSRLFQGGEGRRRLRQRARGTDVCAFDRNLYWNASGKPVLFGKQETRRVAEKGRIRTVSSPTRCSWIRRTEISGCGRPLRRHGSASSRGPSRRSAHNLVPYRQSSVTVRKNRKAACGRHAFARHMILGDSGRPAITARLGRRDDADRPTAYHYRDFVIRALNDDMPYEKFVRWQIAGDEYEPDNSAQSRRRASWQAPLPRC